MYFLKPDPPSGSLHHWQQDPPHPEVQGPGPRPTRGHVLPHQEGRLHPQASGAEQEGQGRQVQAHSRRVQDPSSGQVRYHFSNPLLPFIFSSAVDPCLFGTDPDPDPRIRTTDFVSWNPDPYIRSFNSRMPTIFCRA